MRYEGGQYYVKSPEEMAEILGTMLLRQLNFAPGPA